MFLARTGLNPDLFRAAVARERLGADKLEQASLVWVAGVFEILAYGADGVRPVIAPTLVPFGKALGERKLVMVWPGSASAVLAMSLLAIFTAMPNLACCSFCGQLFGPKRAPKSGAKENCCGSDECVRSRRRRSMSRK